MHAEAGVDLIVIVKQVLDEICQVACAFLTSLKHQDDAAVDLVLMFLEDLRGTQQHSCVAIMPTQVGGQFNFGHHHLWLSAGIHRRLVVGQGINIRSEQDSSAFCFIPQEAEHTAMRYIDVRDSHLCEFLNDECDRVVFVIRDFRMLVQVAAYRYYIFFLCRREGFVIHTLSS